MNIKSFNAFFAALSAAVLMLTSTTASAVGLSLQPTGRLLNTTDAASLTLTISGLGDFQAPSLGDFDIDLSFDPSVLTFQKYTLSGLLGDLAKGDAVDYSLGQTAAGTFNLTAVSFSSAAALDGLQPGTFALATLDFTINASAAGAVTTVSIAKVAALGDGFGNPLTVDGTLGGAVVTVVPEASTPLMMGLGFAAIGWTLLRRRSTIGRPSLPNAG